jgi:hypothetical protein
MHAIAGPASRTRANKTRRPPSSLRPNGLGNVISRTARTAGKTSAAIPAVVYAGTICVAHSERSPIFQLLNGQVHPGIVVTSFRSGRSFSLSRTASPDCRSVNLIDVVGLYLNPPERALVFSADEKSQIQALDRTQPGLPLKRGRCGTMTHDYKQSAVTSPSTTKTRRSSSGPPKPTRSSAKSVAQRQR